MRWSAKWCKGGALGWALDNDADAVGLDARFLGFDMTHILDNAEVRTPVMMYLFHRLTALVDGRRLVIDIDEFWKALGDEAFRGLAQDGLKTYRKQNAFMVFGTQSPADVLRSSIAHTILEQCATKIFLPNAHAAERDYVEGFGLTRREFALVREELAPESRQFLIKQGLNSVVAETGWTTISPSSPAAPKPSSCLIACAHATATTRPNGSIPFTRNGGSPHEDPSPRGRRRARSRHDRDLRARRHGGL